MPRIPTAEIYSPQQQQIGVRMDMGAGDAEWAGLQRVGQASTQVAGFLENYAQKKQEHVNRGKIAEAENLAEQRQQMLDEHIANERDVNRWVEIADQHWNQYSEEIGKMEGVSPMAREVISEFVARASSRSKVKVEAQRANRQVENANASILLRAEHAERNGDTETAEYWYEQLNMPPLAKQNLITATRKAGKYNNALMIIRANYDDEEELKNILGSLQAKEPDTSKGAKDGATKYTHWDGMELDPRLTLENQILARLRQMEQGRLKEVARLNRDIQSGKAGMEDIQQANIDEGDRAFLMSLADSRMGYDVQTSGEYELILEDMQQDYFRQNRWFLPGDQGLEPRQPKDKTYKQYARAIVNAKISKDAQLELFGKLLELKASDLSTFQEEGPDWLWDRDISVSEQALRTSLHGVYRQKAATMGIKEASGMFFKQEEMIRAYFDDPETDKSFDAVRTFYQQLTTQVNTIESEAAMRQFFEDFEQP